jgi:hypothetical protein
MNTPNEPNKDVPSHPPAGGRPGTGRRGVVFQLAALGLILVSALAGMGLAHLLKRPPAPPPFGLKMPERLERTFAAWGRPDLVFLLTAQEHGYMLPCGCSEPQTGGLERRYNFLRLLKARGWDVVALDVGDVAQKDGIQGPVKLPNLQGMLKYVTSMKALKVMGYTAVGLGEFDASLSLGDVLAHYALNEDRPRVLVANLANAEAQYPGQTRPWVEAVEVDADKPGLAVKTGVTALIGPTVQARIKAAEDLKWAPSTGQALAAVLAEMKGAGVELPVLLYQGLLNGNRAAGKPTEAIACAEYFHKQGVELPVILTLSEEDEPPGTPHFVEDRARGLRSAILGLGHKGKYVGVLGAWRTGKPEHPFDFKYQLVEMGPDFATPKGQEAGHPILDLLEAYTKELKDANYLGRYTGTRHELQAMAPVPNLRNPGGPGDPAYVGSKTCKKCHESAYEVWEKTPHSWAYKTLTETEHTRLPNRQFDAECVVCHTVGFGRQGGFTDAARTPHLENVGCESCHGPGSLHVKNSTNPEWQKRMNLAWWKDPNKPETDADRHQRQSRIDAFCQKCHDIDNDVTWKHDGKQDALSRKWPKIAHPTPRGE